MCHGRCAIPPKTIIGVLEGGCLSETWEPPPILKKTRSRTEKAILGATLGIPGYSRSNSRNGSRDLIYVKTLFSEQLSERLSELVGCQNFSPNSRSVFFNIGVVRQSLGSEEFQKPQPLLVSKKVRQYTSNVYGSTPPICIAGPPGF